MTSHLRRLVVLTCLVALAIPLPALALAPPPAWAPVPVSVETTAATGQHRLLRGGKPYLIKGVGGNGSMALLARLGGNSVRTWGADNLGPILDEAHRHGLTVTAGVWLGHERHGFNYNNADQVAKQYADVRAVVLRYRNHPALLMWGVGNEMEGYGKGDNAAVWSAVNSIALMVKKLDPNHPTMTVVAEVGGDRVRNIHRLCPGIDVVGINSYAGAATVPERYRQAGGTKPYVLAEFGPPGVWETTKNTWGAAPELSSTDKAAHYRRAYEKAVLAPKGVCLGSYAFLWGQKQEATATWFGLLAPGGKRLAATDTLSELWTGKPVSHPCPEVRSLTLTGPAEVAPGASVMAKLDIRLSGKEQPRVRWVLQREAEALGEGGDAEAVPATFPKAILQGGLSGATVQLPRDGGGYRLFAFIEDDHGGAATANVPLLVKGPRSVAPAARATLPLVVYDEATRKNAAYVPTGWMGDTKAVKMSESCTDSPRQGKTCIRIDHTQATGWAGIVWQSPPNDWGDRAGGWDLRGAKKLSFWARGEAGGEQISVELGLLGKGKRYPDSASAKQGNIRLTREWKQYTIDLKGKDLSRIKTGFACVWSAGGKALTFYLDDVRYE